nr:uncharacterized protein LOC104085025 [Nicotiana tomentosiformis]
MVSLDGKKKADLMKTIHEHTRLAIERNNEQTALRRNKGRKPVIFEPGDLVWVHMRKERFPSKRKTKLHRRGDGPFKVLERIGDNTYKLDLPGEFQISATFNVADLSFFDVGSNLRTNSFQEEGNDSSTDKDKALEAPKKPFTRSQAKEKQDKVVGLQWEIKKALMVEEELKNYGEDLAKCYTHFMVQVQVQEEVDWGLSTSQGGSKLGT